MRSSASIVVVLVSLLCSSGLASSAAAGPVPATTSSDLDLDLDLDPIVGGEAVAPGAYPSVLAVVVEPLLCTGTLIAPNIVLTAAHCFGHAQPGATVSLFAGDRREPGQPVASSADWGLHPQYCGAPNCGDDAYDFAYIVLNQPLDLTPIPTPVLVPEQWASVMNMGQGVTLVGFGENEQGAQREKLFTSTQITSFTPGKLQFRAGGEGRDSCVGDSGGPAFVELSDGSHVLAGVLSAGSEPCGSGGMYGSSVAPMEWLREFAGYEPPLGSCTTIECLEPDLPSDETGTGGEGDEDTGDGCAMAAGSSSPWSLAGLALVGLGMVRRRRPSQSEGGSRGTRISAW